MKYGHDTVAALTEFAGNVKSLIHRSPLYKNPRTTAVGVALAGMLYAYNQELIFASPITYRVAQWVPDKLKKPIVDIIKEYESQIRAASRQGKDWDDTNKAQDNVSDNLEAVLTTQFGGSFDVDIQTWDNKQIRQWDRTVIIYRYEEKHK